MSARRNPKTEKLRNDLQNAENLLDSWARDPAGLFVRYGIASSKGDVKVREAPGWCGCACAFTIELEFEKSGYAPAAFETQG